MSSTHGTYELGWVHNKHSGELGINWLYNRRYFYCLQVRGMYACMICIMCMYFCRCTCRNWYWRDLVCPKMERPAGSVALPEIATKKRWIYGWIHWSPTKVAWTWTLDVSKCPSPAHRCPADLATYPFPLIPNTTTQDPSWLVVSTCFNPSEKSESQLGWWNSLKFPIWKVIKVMFQTTNQIMVKNHQHDVMDEPYISYVGPMYWICSFWGRFFFGGPSTPEASVRNLIRLLKTLWELLIQLLPGEPVNPRWVPGVARNPHLEMHQKR
jgi:hypothetical protein